MNRWVHNFLGGQWFHDKESMKKSLTDFFRKKKQVQYTTGIDKLLDQYEKCLAKYGNYVEK